MSGTTKTTRKYTAASCMAAGLCFSDKVEADNMAATLGNVFTPFEYNGWWYLRKDRGLTAAPLWLVSVE